MAKYTSNFSGQEVDQGVAKAFEDVGDAYFDPTTNRQYLFKTTEDKMAWIGGDTSVEVKICPFEFSGTVNRMTVINFMDSKNLFYTQMSESATITVGFKSEEKGITDTSWQEVNEDARITVEIDRGVTGKYTTIVNEQLVLNGDTLSFDVFKYLATGNNRVRVTVIGVDTGTSSNIIYSVLLTSMYIAPANFAWNTPFIEGQAYNLGGLYIGGNIDKILKIKVSNEQTYSRLYEINIGTQTHTSIAYYYSGLEFPTDGTGVYNVEMWLDANGLESEHLHYNIMCVAATDLRTAQLIAVSNVLPTVKNYDTNKLFSYAVYNGGATTSNPVVNVSAIINNTPTPIVKNETLAGVVSGVINDYIVDLAIETQESNIQLYSSIELGDSKQEAVYAIDNSASFPAVAGAVFYMNPANRNNTQDNKTTIINESNVAKVPTEYTATWKSVSFTDGMDGWTVDNYGRKCLRLPAGSFLEVDYAPLANATTRTIELYYRAENTANYNEDIISIASALTSDFVGARIKPTNVLLHSDLLRTDDLMQGYNTKDEELVHLIITVIQNYKQIGNLAQIYVNGVKKCSFEWSASDTFAHNGKLLFGSNTSDLCIYKTRVYTDAFDWIMAAQNFISCLPDTASKKAAHAKMQSVLNDGNQIDFDKVKSGGFNYFVLRLPDGAKLPSILSQSSVKHCRLEINIQQNPLFAINGIYEDEETEGQGTTAMNYFVWNLRWKTLIIRITAKKNFASSMHSHKMGATALFNDLNRMIVGANEADARVAVEQYGAYGFLEVLKEGTTDQYTYVPIGLYTIGQDKGDKTTFGYNNKTYKDTLIHLEGTDHSPKAVGMDYPWAKLGVVTNTDGDANLGVLNPDGTVVAAWEIGACGSAESDAEMREYLTQEFYPGYDCDYRNTSMLVGLPAGTSIDDVNANLSAFRATETDLGYTYADCLVWIDGEYETYYYDVIEEKYLKDGLNILDDLGIEESDLTSTTVSEKNNEIRALRMARYRADMENYWHLRDNLFHYCFVVLFAATDNFKKNTYPYKFGTLASGSRWRWRQDDLDTLADINNQGLANKIYSILNGDKSGTTHLFRGNTSYHWTNIQFYYENEIKSMMLEILTAMASLSDTGDSLIEKALGCVRKYFWDKAQDYFTKSAYNLDAEWTYEEAWAAMKNGTYKAPVHPLQQSLGSHYEAERAWFELRFIFMASLYGFGAFGVGNDSDTSLGQISFRPAQGDNTFGLTPAINMNPTILVGDSDKKSADGRLMAGETAEITVSTDGDTSIYIQGADYLSDIGDFSKINLYAENPALTIQSKRLQKLKVGDENAENVTTVLKTLNVLSCPSLSEVDARNVSTLTGTVDLSKCPRLKKALFGGSSTGEIALPRGSKITEFELPDSITNLSLVNLPNLSYSSVESGVLSDYEINKYYLTNQGVGNVCTLEPTSAGSWACKKFDCSNIISMTITGVGGNGPRLWCFLDAENKIISVADQGAQATNLIVPVPDGAKTAVVNFGNTGNTVYSIVVTVKDDGLKIGDLTALSYLRVENSPNIQGFALLKATFEDGAPLTNIRVIGFDYNGDSGDVQLLAQLASGGYFGINEDGSRNPNIIPVIEGTLNVVGSIYEDDEEVIEEKYGAGLILNVTGGYYIRFNDPAWQELVAAAYGDGVGITQEQADAVTTITVNKFASDTTVTEITDLYKFRNLNTINSNAFGKNVTTLYIPDSVTTLGNLPNSQFTKLILGKGVNKILCCLNQKSLTQFVIPDTATEISQQAFDGASGLKRLVLGRGITSTGAHALRGVDLDALYIPSVVDYLNISFNGSSYFNFANTTIYIGTIDEITEDKGIYGDIVVDYDWAKLETTRKELTIEDVNEGLKNVDNIPLFAICNYKKFSSDATLVIPSNINTIGQNSFENTIISSLQLSEGIKTIGLSAFANTGITGDLVIPDSVTSLREWIFNSFKSGTDRLFIKLNNISFNNQLGRPTFNGTGFAEIHIDNLQKLFENSFPIILNSSKNGWKLFVNDVETTEITIDCPQNHTIIPMVMRYSNLTKVIINEGVTEIQGTAFASCTNIKYFELPSTITNLNNQILMNATPNVFICKAVQPPTLSTLAMNYANCWLHVPNESVDAYKSATGWSIYAAKIKPFFIVEELPTVAEDGALYIVGDTYHKAVIIDGGVLTWETI